MATKNKKSLVVKTAAAVIISMTVAACDRALIETENAQTHKFSLSNGCGLEKDVFFVRLFTAKTSPPDSEIVDLSHEQFMHYLNSKQEEVNRLIGEAFENASEREERFRSEAERLMGGHNSEDCIYLKLRIAEILELE